MKVGVLGLWHLGTVTAACLSQVHELVIGVEIATAQAAERGCMASEILPRQPRGACLLSAEFPESRPVV